MSDERQILVPLNDVARQVLAALEKSQFAPQGGYFSTQSFCLAVPVGLPVDSFQLGVLLSCIDSLEVSHDHWPNGRQFVVFPAALVRLGYSHVERVTLNAE